LPNADQNEIPEQALNYLKMKWKLPAYIAFILFGQLFMSCYHFQDNDLNYYEGTWAIESVEVNGEVLFSDYGEIVIDEYGRCDLFINRNGLERRGVFNIVTPKGADVFIELFGAMWIGSDGEADDFMCSRENSLSVQIDKAKGKSMIWIFDPLLTATYTCESLVGSAEKAQWILKKQ
jgi:hypothetical protein